MRPICFDPSVLRQQLRRNKIAALLELKRVLGTDTDLTVFRKLKELDYLASYTHRGRFYTLPEFIHFDDRGLWSHEGVWFSRHGTLLATAEIFVNQSSQGYYAHELADELHAKVQQPLRHLVAQQRLARIEIDGQFLYTAVDSLSRRKQTLARRSTQTVPVAVHGASLQASPDELKTAILLFYGLLDEQQRRLFAGLESIRLGHGGDTLLSDFLGLDVHTVARGRQQLLEQNVIRGRTRRLGGGFRRKKARHNRRSPLPAGTRYRGRSHHRRWSRRTTTTIAQELARLEIAVSPNSVSGLLHDLGYSLRVNQKQISTKNPGQRWESAPRCVYDHDFRTD